MLSRTKQKPIFESYEERKRHFERSLPKMHKETLAITPLTLVVPLFSIARDKAGSPKVAIDAVWSNGKRGNLRYIGPRLTQSHQTVLFTLANLRGGGEIVSNAFSFYPTELLTKMGWSTRTENVVRLREMLDDLVEGRLRLWGADEELASALRVSFVGEFQPSVTGRWYVTLSEKLLPLFQGEPTYVNLPNRAKLQEGLATFLYSYILSSDCKLAFNYQDLHDACGACYDNLQDFATTVKATLAKLKEAGLIADYRLKGCAEDMAKAAGDRMKKGEFRVLRMKAKAA